MTIVHYIDIITVGCTSLFTFNLREYKYKSIFGLSELQDVSIQILDNLCR